MYRFEQHKQPFCRSPTFTRRVKLKADESPILFQHTFSASSLLDKRMHHFHRRIGWVCTMLIDEPGLGSLPADLSPDSPHPLPDSSMLPRPEGEMIPDIVQERLRSGSDHVLIHLLIQSPWSFGHADLTFRFLY